MSLYRWKRELPYEKKRRDRWGTNRVVKIDTDKALWAYVMIKNGVPAWKVDPNGIYRRWYKHLVGWHTVVDRKGNVLKGPNEDIKRLHEEGIL